MKFLLPALLILCSCAQEGLGLVARAHVDGDGLVATDGNRTLILAAGRASAGIYQVSEDGELRLTRPLVESLDSVRVIDRDLGLDAETDLGKPLPAWTEAVIRTLLTGEEIGRLGLTWEE